MSKRIPVFDRAKEINHNSRVFAVNIFFAIFFIFLSSRLFSLQIKNYSYFAGQAEIGRSTIQVLSPERGIIYFQDKNKNLVPAVINKKYFAVYAVPKEIENPKETSAKLAELIPLPFEEIYSRLNKEGDPYEPLMKKVDDENLIEKIKKEGLKGIYIKDEHYRFYPFDSLAAQTIGFVAEADDGKIRGRYGLEAYYDDVLSGRAGEFKGVKDAFGRLIRSLFSQEKKIKEGANIIVTIDKNIQFAGEKALNDLIKERKAAKGSLIVMEVKTGKVLALANYPSFDLNQFQKVKDYSLYRNYAVEERYEPGSIIKTITMAAGLDLGKVKPDTTYIDKGYYEIGRYKITNYKNRVYGRSTMTKVLEQSINTGSIFVANEIGIENLRKYFKKFGLEELSGIDLPNEIKGDLSNLEYPKSNPSHLATASFGGGIAVTPMSLLRAYAAIINNGLSVTPYLMESIVDENGVYTSYIPPEPQRVIAKETAETLTNMLVSVIENGFGGNAKVKGYSLGGKTGTAFIPLFDQKGYSDDEIHSFAGFFPASNPRFIILVKLDRPQWGEMAASYTVTLAFREVEKFLINYYNIPPDETPHLEKISKFIK